MRLSEIYTSIQGEGPFAGHPTQFIRFAGCNLRCPGWPCDTQHAIDPAIYRHEWEKASPAAIMTRLQEYPKRVTLTGGEPFLQPEAELVELYDLLMVHDDYFVEIFTNGTFKFPTWAIHTTTKIVDWKLPDSGEDCEDKVRIDNIRRLWQNDAVKFVCASKDDFQVARDLAEEHIISQRPQGMLPHLYMGAAWNKVEEAELVEWMLSAQLDERLWKLNVQVHNYLWPRDERRR